MILFYRHSRQWVTSASSETAPTEASSKQQELHKKGAYKLFYTVDGRPMQGGYLLQQCHQRCSSSFHSSRLLESHPADHRPACRAADCFFLRFFCHREESLSQEPHGPFFFLRPVMHMPCGCGIRSLPLRACVNTAAIPGMAVNSGGRKCPQSG